MVRRKRKNHENEVFTALPGIFRTHLGTENAFSNKLIANNVFYRKTFSFEFVVYSMSFNGIFCMYVDEAQLVCSNENIFRIPDFDFFKRDYYSSDKQNTFMKSQQFFEFYFIMIYIPAQSAEHSLIASHTCSLIA